MSEDGRFGWSQVTSGGVVRVLQEADIWGEGCKQETVEKQEKSS